MKHLLPLLLLLSFQAVAQNDSTGINLLTNALGRMETAFQMLEDPDKRNCLFMLQKWIDKQETKIDRHWGESKVSLWTKKPLIFPRMMITKGRIIEGLPPVFIQQDAYIELSKDQKLLLISELEEWLFTEKLRIKHNIPEESMAKKKKLNK